MSRRNSFNIPMSYKLNDFMLEQLDEYCDKERQTYSGAVRTGLTLLFTKRHRKNTGNTGFSGSSVEGGW